MKKQKTFTLAEQILMLIAGGMDFIKNSRSIHNAFPYLLGDPSKAKNFIKMQGYLKDRKKRKSLFAIISSLKRRKLIKKVSRDTKYAYFLTESGENEVRLIHAQINKKKKLPTGSWIMVLFDVPEKERFKRDNLRNFLILLGYEQFQKSIWISPHDVMRETVEYINFLKVKKYTKILIVKNIDN